MSLTLLEIVALTGIFTLAGTVKGAIGLGLPTVSMGLLSLMMPPGQAAALLLLPSLITNLWQLLCGPRLGALCRRLWPMMLCVTLGTLLSAGTLTAIDGRLAPLALGICLTGYALLGFTRFDWRGFAAAEAWVGALGGLLSGGLDGATRGVVIQAGASFLRVGVWGGGGGGEAGGGVCLRRVGGAPRG
ncbi:sulfite exporter TauE/SafE family protein [Klebsiella pneumoniae]|nr:sulfite exporter TauE/SafE family protein [Klebsiella pneumoniae]